MEGGSRGEANASFAGVLVFYALKSRREIHWEHYNPNILTVPTCLFDIEQLLVEAQHRWLRPAEICEILQNHRKFRIAPEPPNKPQSGSLFLFDRKVLRYFRKDGHNWRKKKDGKTVKEAHERLKVGSVDMLHCYYAHGEENEKFQRRSYWMLEDDLMHIVLVHYREVKDRPSLSRSTSLSHTRDDQIQPPSQVIGGDSPNSAHTSEYEDAESAYSKQDSKRQIIIRQVPDTTLSLRCGDMMID